MKFYNDHSIRQNIPFTYKSGLEFFPIPFASFCMAFSYKSFNLTSFMLTFICAAHDPLPFQCMRFVNEAKK